MSCVMDLLKRVPARLRANDPDPDSYETKVRVLSLICLAVLSAAPGTGGLYMSFEPAPTPLPTGRVLIQIGLFLWPFSWTSVFVWALIAGRTTAVMMDVLIGGSLLASVLASLGSPSYDVPYVSMTLFAGTSMIVGTTWWKLWFSLSHVVGVLQAYNRLALHAGWRMAAIDPWKEENISDMSYAIATFGFGTGSVILCATLLLQHFEHVRSKEAANAAAEVTAAIALKLQVYDTTAAAEALKREAATGVDKELKAAFTALVANLESYRPYLPNWLLASTEEDLDAEHDHDSSSASHLSHGLSKLQQASGGNITSHNGRSSSVGAAGALQSFHSSSDVSLQMVAGAGVERAESIRSGHAGAFDDAWVRRPRSDRSSVHSGTSASTPYQLNTHHHSSPLAKGAVNTRVAALEKQTVLKGSVTFAVIEYVTEDVPDAALSETLTAVADAVHRCAAECKGAVHTMLLGEIVVSWNVATRVAGPEAKAAKFLLSLKTALAADENVHHGFKAVAAAASHHARSETIGTSKKLLTSERTGTLRHKLRGVLRFAWAAQRKEQKMSTLLSVVLLDERTTREASSNFIISAGAVLDLTAHLPSARGDSDPLSGHARMIASPQNTSPAPQPMSISPAASTASCGPSEVSPMNAGRLPGTVRGATPPLDPSSAVNVELQLTPHRPLRPSVSDSCDCSAVPARKSFAGNAGDMLPGQARSPFANPLTNDAAALHGSPKEATVVSNECPSLMHEHSGVTTESPRSDKMTTGDRVKAGHGVVHVFDLVSARKGGDDEWLYAMEEGAADAARAAQLMVGAGLRRQSGGVDAAAVRAAFEEAGKQRDGAAIMARPLVRQMIEGLQLLPLHV